MRISIILLILILSSCTSTTTPEAVQLQFFQNEIDYYEKQYIDEVLEKDSLMMDSVGNIIPMKYQK